MPPPPTDIGRLKYHGFQSLVFTGCCWSSPEKFVTEIGVRQFLLKNLYWIEEGKLGLRPNIAVLKNAAESIGASIASDKQFVKPTLFLQGENSNYINTDSDRQDITRLFPKANITSIKKAGHWLHTENPRDFFDSLTTWLG